MQQVKKEAILQAIKFLQATGCQFKIIDSNGDEYGDLAVTKSKGTKNRKYRPGEMHKHYLPYVEHLKVGEVASIPIEPFDKSSLSGAVCGWCSAHWGNKTYKSCTTESEVQVLRCM